MGNKGAYIHLRGSDLNPEFHQFTAVVSLLFVSLFFAHCNSSVARRSILFCSLINIKVLLKFVFISFFQPHPNVKPMAYANTLMQMGLM